MFVPGRMLHVKQQLRMFLWWELVVNLLRRQGTDNYPLPVLTASSDQLVDPVKASSLYHSRLFTAWVMKVQNLKWLKRNPRHRNVWSVSSECMTFFLSFYSCTNQHQLKDTYVNHCLHRQSQMVNMLRLARTVSYFAKCAYSSRDWIEKIQAS